MPVTKNHIVWSAPRLSARAKIEAVGIRRDYSGQMRRREWSVDTNAFEIVELDVHISSDPIAPGVPAVGWNKLDVATHRRQAFLDRAASTRARRAVHTVIS